MYPRYAGLMLPQSFAHVETWIFDLDHTLYPPETKLFDQISARMTDFMVRHLGISEVDANRLRKEYWRDYGTTLAGLMREHEMPPQPFLDDVHDIRFEVLEPAPDLRRGIDALPGRKIIYTNGHKPYAEAVLAALGLSGCFQSIYGIEHADYRPKPERAAFEMVFEKDGLSPRNSAMFEDDIRNLVVPYDLGVRTVHVAPVADPHDHIHHHTDDLTAFLAEVCG